MLSKVSWIGKQDRLGNLVHTTLIFYDLINLARSGMTSTWIGGQMGDEREQRLMFVTAYVGYEMTCYIKTNNCTLQNHLWIQQDGSKGKGIC